MRSKNFKGSKCVKMKLSKSDEVVKTFDNIQTAYAQILDKNENIQKIQCNVPLEGIERWLNYNKKTGLFFPALRGEQSHFSRLSARLIVY